MIQQLVDYALGRAPDDSRAGLLRERLRVRPGATAVYVVYAGTALYAGLFLFAAVLAYTEFVTGRADLGNMVQAIWSTMHGHLLEATTQQGHQLNRLGAHVDPFLLFFVPLFWFSSSPLILPIVQVIAVASGALPVFWLARKHLDSSRAGAHFAFAYLLYPATQFNAFTVSSSFHAVALAVPLLLFAIWFLDEDRLVAFSIVALLACTTKEEIPLAVGCLGIWYAVRKGRRLFGLSVFAVGLSITLFDFLWVIPHFSPTGADLFAHDYSAVGGTPSGIAHRLFTDPAAFVHAVATTHKGIYLALLIVPFLGLCLLEPLLMLGAIPDLAINLLSGLGEQTSIPFHWTAGIVPFVVAASIFGAARFRQHAESLSLWVLIGAACLAVYSPVYILKVDLHAYASQPVVAAEAHAVGLIPGGVSVSASNQLGAHLSERRYIYTFPSVGRSQWIIVNVDDPTYGNLTGYKAAVRTYEGDRAWRIVFRSHGVAVLHRRPTAGP